MAEIFKSVTELMKTARGNKALGQCLCDIVDFQEIIDDTPTADVQEVKHGEWITQNLKYNHMCSICEHSAFYSIDGVLCNYCPNCGAKMDGGKSG